ncbi:MULTISPECIES: hypothetical protein [Aphanothece]|uniref:hypothetical protein n=1 Tax=Aphanothece TaxID=1121 RepID=UPI0039848A7E
MQLQARLVHAESGSRVVEVSAHQAGALLGSALGEAATAEEAEDRALERLQRRLGHPPQRPPAPPPAPLPPAASPSAPAPSPSAPSAPSATAAPPSAPAESPATSPARAMPAAERGLEPPADPEDWSSELAEIDLLLRGLGWQREQEGAYLERAFGHPSRHRLTTYADLQAYLQALRALPPDSHPESAPVPLRRRDLLAQCDQLLGQLGWDAARGRQCLEQHFSLTSRQQLSDTQLLQFNMLLEEALMNGSADKDGPAGMDGPAAMHGPAAGP